eukprot:7108656-Pyramimonas_sp.AAC.1
MWRSPQYSKTKGVGGGIRRMRRKRRRRRRRRRRNTRMRLVGAISRCAVGFPSLAESFLGEWRLLARGGGGGRGGGQDPGCRRSQREAGRT